jgi:O-antigen/teichoic acid export membrane protein
VFLRARDQISRQNLFGSAIPVFCSGVAVGAALAVVLLATEGWHGLDTVQVLLVCAPVPLIAFYLEGQSALRGVERRSMYRRAVVGFDFLFLVAVGVAFSVSRSLTASLAAWSVAWLIGAIWVALLLLRACGFPRIPLNTLRLLASIGLPQALVALLVQANLRMDVVILQGLKGSAEVGQYAVAFGATAVIAYGGMAIGLMLFPYTAEQSRHDPVGGARTTAVAVRSSLALAVVGGALLAIAGPFVLRLLMGDAFSPAAVPLRILVPGAIAAAVVAVLQNDLSARGRFWLMTSLIGGSVALHICLAFALIPSLGTSGAALASTITYTATAVVVLLLFTRTTGTPLLACLNIFDVSALQTLPLFRTRPALSFAERLPLPRSRSRAQGAGRQYPLGENGSEHGGGEHERIDDPVGGGVQPALDVRRAAVAPVDRDPEHVAQAEE